MIKALGLPTDNMDMFSVGSAFRVKETGDCMEVIEYFGGNKKIVTFKYNEEFDYDRPGKQYSSQQPIHNHMLSLQNGISARREW